MDGDTQMETDEQGSAHPQCAPPPRALPSRACIECRRKKSKCDMKRPECSLCYRIGETCVYPARRAPGRRRLQALHKTSQQLSESLVTESSEISIESSQRSCSTINASLENGSHSQKIDHTLSISAFTLSNEQMASPSAFLDLSGNAEANFDFSVDNFEELSENGISNFLLMWPGNEAVSSTISTNAGQGGSRITDEAITLPSTWDTAATRVDRNTLKEQCLVQDPTYTIAISSKIAFSLIDEFFNHVHSCVPLLSSVNLKKDYDYLRMADTERLDHLSLESALLLNGIFALSARFSKGDMFVSEAPVNRGQRFFQEATRLFEISCQLLNKTCNSLKYMQGVILLTFNALQSGPSRQAWFLCGICARLSCELGLHDTDADLIAGVIDYTQLEECEWKHREERRRAWWVVWDMDTFANGVAFTPFALNVQQAKVLLPMTDEAWHGSQNILTAHLDADDPTPWTKFSDTSCQSAWAWFLAGTTLLRQAVDIASSAKLAAQDMDSLEARADCFAMALPEMFHLESKSSYFDQENFEEVNWIVSTQLMLQCSLSLARLRTKTSNALPGSRLQVSRTDVSPELRAMPDLQSTQECHRLRKEVARIVKAWSPQHLIYSGPLVTFLLLGPAFVNMLSMEKANSRGGLDMEITKLVLKRLGRYWMVAENLFDDVRSLELGEASAPSSRSPGQKTWPPILSIHF